MAQVGVECLGSRPVLSEVDEVADIVQQRGCGQLVARARSNRQLGCLHRMHRLGDSLAVVLATPTVVEIDNLIDVDELRELRRLVHTGLPSKSLIKLTWTVPVVWGVSRNSRSFCA